MVDGLNMDKLFTSEQVAQNTAVLTTGSDANLAFIATSMSKISSKDAIQSANNDKEETIDYNNMSKDV